MAETENVDFAGSKQEYDNRAGYVLPVGRVKLDMGFIRYGYINADANYDTLEGAVTVSGDIGKLNAHVGVNYTRNYFGTHLAAEYYEAGATWQVRRKLALTATLAHQTVDRSMRYNTCNFGLDYTIRKGLDVVVTYSDADAREFGNLGGARVFGSVNVSF